MCRLTGNRPTLLLKPAIHPRAAPHSGSSLAAITVVTAATSFALVILPTWSLSTRMRASTQKDPLLGLAINATRRISDGKTVGLLG